ncbi:hypothetical protein ACFP1I_17715 [Dyadobacter subterraneus]|nr:hypothetical protein [Dyadobacter subterraneus]
MNPLFLLSLMLLSSFSQSGKSQENSIAVSGKVGNMVKEKIREFTVVENDTLQYTLKLKFDDSGKPQYFFRNIFTPVCYTNECKPVHINFYWDLLGNYVRYDLPEGKVLTKVDHEEFKAEDYEKLQDILARQNSIFADLKMEDLITKGTDDLSDSVDAKTGATLKTIKNEVIDGAVYTCFTLWKIAYGKAVPEMLKITESYKNDKMLHDFLADKNYHYQYWAMEKVINKDGRVLKTFEPDIEKIIAGKNLYTARTALQKTENDFFSKPQKQNWLWETFQSASYPMQIAILKKLSTIPLNQTLTENIANGLVASNDEQRKLKIELLKKQSGLSDKSREILDKAMND